MLYGLLLALRRCSIKWTKSAFDRAQSPETEATFLEGFHDLLGASACYKVSKRAEASSLCGTMHSINNLRPNGLWHPVRNCATRLKKPGSLRFFSFLMACYYAYNSIQPIEISKPELPRPPRVAPARTPAEKPWGPACG